MSCHRAWGRHAGVIGLLGALLAGTALVTTACSDEEAAPETTPTDDAGTEPVNDSGISTTPTDASEGADGDTSTQTECTVTITPSPTETYVELCKPAQGTVKHVRLVGVKSPEPHGFGLVAFGFDAPPADSQGSLEGDQFRLTLYGGKGFAPPALVQARFAGQEEILSGDASFVRSGATVCFDLHDGAVDKSPYFALWVDGQKGASCATRSTLTAASAYGVRASFGSVVGVVAKDAKIFYGQTGGLATGPTITLSSVPAITP